MQPITIHQDGYAEVHLAHGYVAKIDIEDIPLIQGFTWRVWNQHRRQYARTTLRKAGKRTELAMHRLLMNADSDVLVDHINHDALDNRRTVQCTPKPKQSSKVHRQDFITIQRRHIPSQNSSMGSQYMFQLSTSSPWLFCRRNTSRYCIRRSGETIFW